MANKCEVSVLSNTPITTTTTTTTITTTTTKVVLPFRVRQSLLALVDTFLPSLPCPKDDPDNKEFWTHAIRGKDDGDGDDDERYVEALEEIIFVEGGMKVVDRWKLFGLMYVLSTSIGTMLLFGISLSWSNSFRPFPRWILSDRVKALQSWKDANPQHWWNTPKLEAFHNLKGLLCAIALGYTLYDTTTTTDHAPSMNPYWKGMRYPGPIHKYYHKDEDEQKVKAGTVYDLRKEGAVMDYDELLSSKQQQQQPPKSTNGKKKQEEEEEVLEFDVIVVGSGASGGVTSSILSQAGYSVLVIEKGTYVSSSDVENIEGKAIKDMYEQRGLIKVKDQTMALLAGSTVGGGTQVNWGCCLELPTYVREQWSQQHGLTQFTTSTYNDSLTAIQQRISCRLPKDAVHPKRKHQPHNQPNQLLLQMCQNQGYKVFSAETNFLNPEWDSAGYTSCGDRYKNKQTGTVTFLKDAVQNGKTKILEKTKVEKILRQGRRAIGVQISFAADNNNISTTKKKKKNIILAKHCVICCAGALHTPCLLMRSKFKNKYIGKHLFLHPTCGFSATFPPNTTSSTDNKQKENKQLKAVFGAPMTVICDEFAKGPKDDGYGAKVEIPCLHTSLLAGLKPWMDPYQFKSFLHNAFDSMGIIVLQRDSGEGGVVRNDSNGYDVLVDYTINDEDEDSMMHALTKSIEMCIRNGASTISPFFNIESLHLEKEDNVDSPLVRNYLKQLNEIKLKHFAGTLGNAHQMGSCRMGTSSQTSAVDEDGKLWESDNVFVMDTSIFPTALGVNPMLTVLSISHMLSTRLSNSLSQTQNINE